MPSKLQRTQPSCTTTIPILPQDKIKNGRFATGRGNGALHLSLHGDLKEKNAPQDPTHKLAEQIIIIPLASRTSKPRKPNYSDAYSTEMCNPKLSLSTQLTRPRLSPLLQKLLEAHKNPQKPSVLAAIVSSET